MINSEKSYALGAGSGAMSCLDGHCGELVINENLITDESRSIIARVSPDKKCIVEKYTAAHPAAQDAGGLVLKGTSWRGAQRHQ